MNVGVMLTPRRVDSADPIQVMMDECDDAPTRPIATCADLTRQPGTGRAISVNETFIKTGYNNLQVARHKRVCDRPISGKGFDLIESADTIGLPGVSCSADVDCRLGAWAVHRQTFRPSREYFGLTDTAAKRLPLSVPSSTPRGRGALYDFNGNYRVGLHVYAVSDKAPPRPGSYGAAEFGRLLELSFQA